MNRDLPGHGFSKDYFGKSIWNSVDGWGIAW